MDWLEIHDHLDDMQAIFEELADKNEGYQEQILEANPFIELNDIAKMYSTLDKMRETAYRLWKENPF